MRYRILGTLEVRLGAGGVELNGPRYQKVLAALLLEPNGVVTVSHLVDVLWDLDPPANAVKVARNCVSVVRAALRADDGEQVLTTTPYGYRLKVDQDELDSLSFCAGVEQATALAQHGPLVDAVACMHSALGLWRGPALTGLVASGLRPAIARLDEQYLAAWERQAEWELALGRHRYLVDRLTGVVAEHPTHERLVGHLMLALYRSGRTADALAVFQRLRTRMLDELGAEPTAQLIELNVRMLWADPALTIPVSAAEQRPVLAGRSQVGPRQLPRPPKHFVGRRAALDTLESWESSGSRRAEPVIASIDGTAGVGKTALAVYWAHQIAHRYPDGQLYINLCGFDPFNPPVSPALALNRFLEALGVRPERMPHTMDGKAALYRSELAGRRMLILLDNASDARQVRPLLPGSVECLVIITSRNTLTGLVATDGAEPMTLGLLDDEEAGELLALRLGAERTAEEPRATADLAALCARLPLALCIAAARAIVGPGGALSALVSELADTHRRLDALDTGDPLGDVRAVFSWSYHLLSEAARQMFRLLGLHRGPDLSAAAAASLAALPLHEAGAALDELVSAALLVEHGGRFSFHDLLRVYAVERTMNEDPDDRRRRAVVRMLDHYLHSSRTAAIALQPTRSPIHLPSASTGTMSESVYDIDSAWSWFDVETLVIRRVVACAVDYGADIHSWQLPWCLAGYLDRRGRWQEWVDLQDIALDASRRLADNDAQARVHISRGHALTQLGRLGDAYQDLQDANRLFEHAGNVVGQAQTWRDMALLHERENHDSQALRHAERALTLYGQAGDRAGYADALSQVGWYCARLGRHDEAVALCRRALALHHERGSRAGEASTWDSLGFAYHRLGRYSEAVCCYERALQLFRLLHNRYFEAGSLVSLGDALESAGMPEKGAAAWRDALTILDELQHTDAEGVRRRLAESSPSSIEVP
jgi:DNA-binding SARP family transcriptional activator